MENFRVAKKASFLDKYNKADGRLQRISKTIGAFMAILAAGTGVCTWISSQFQQSVSAQINDLTSEIKESDKQQNQAITRLELMNLIQNDPTNKAAIEKMARYYFITLDGDLYVTERYSEWAEQYGGDISIIIGEK